MTKATVSTMELAANEFISHKLNHGLHTSNLRQVHLGFLWLGLGSDLVRRLRFCLGMIYPILTGQRVALANLWQHPCRRKVPLDHHHY